MRACSARVLVAVLCLNGCTLQGAAPALEVPGRRPNIVLIVADDLGCGSLGCYGSREVNTPNLDRLAANGMRFTDFHSNGPMCTPTRAALMTGRYQQRCAWVDDSELSPVFREQRRNNMKQRWAWGVAIGERTIADLLKRAGYRTGIIGKWHLGYDFGFHPMNQGFDEFRGFVGGAVDYHTHIASHGLQALDWWKDWEVENEPGYVTDLLTGYATDFIARNKERAFFLYLAHAAPHDPLQGRDPKRKKSPAETYREMIEVLDESVGKVQEALREHHLGEKTLVIFCSDNGPAPPRGHDANGKFRGGKGSLYEGGHRVPCIISWPGVVPAGSVSGDPVLTMDFFPTFANLAGAAPAEDREVDGMDLLPILRGDGGEPGRVLHWRFGDRWAVRKGDWKLIDDKVLYHLGKDPAETKNIYAEHPEVVEQLRNLNRQWTREVGGR